MLYISHIHCRAPYFIWLEVISSLTGNSGVLNISRLMSGLFLAYENALLNTFVCSYVSSMGL